MNRADVQAWLNRYVAAWAAYDADSIGDLFSEGAEYRFQPWDEPVIGRSAIVDAWLRPGGDETKRDAPGTFTARYDAYVADGQRAVALGTTTYWTDAGQTTATRTYYNAFVMEFDGDSRCRSFTEYFMKPRG
jgi:SnoaL-like domain